jgi:hypothetical protein
MRNGGWSVAPFRDGAEFSCWPKYSGNKASRPDQALVSRHFDIVYSSYETDNAGFVFGGPRSRTPLSDHAILVLDLKLQF